MTEEQNKPKEGPLYIRRRQNVGLHDLFPIREDGLCACGCKEPLTGRRTRWATNECNQKAYHEFQVWRGDVAHVRWALWLRDKGICARCGKDDPHWQADHIIAVVNGGGCPPLEGYQTLCVKCHKFKTRADMIIRGAKR